MSRDFDDIRKKIDQSHKELHKQDTAISKDQEKLLKEIHEVKKEVNDIAFKVDTILEILNSFTIMLAEDDDLQHNYDIEDTDESWVPKEDPFWEDDNTDE